MNTKHSFVISRSTLWSLNYYHKIRAITRMYQILLNDPSAKALNRYFSTWICCPPQTDVETDARWRHCHCPLTKKLSMRRSFHGLTSNIRIRSSARRQSVIVVDRNCRGFSASLWSCQLVDHRYRHLEQIWDTFCRELSSEILTEIA